MRSRNTIQRSLVLEAVNKLRCHDHCHVQCEKCGRVFDVDMEFVTGLEKGIQDAHGFAFTGYEILFHGVCPDCQRSPQEKL